MTVEVLFFAVTRERAGRERETLQPPPGANLRDVLALIAERHPPLAPLLPRVRVARNRRFASLDEPVGDGDEIALIPPVAGGADGPAVRLVADSLSLDAVVAAVAGPTQGAIVTFTGTVRRHGQQPNVARLEYEAYGDMAAAEMSAIVAEIERATPSVRCAVHHRVGTLSVGEIAVVIAASAPHRAEAFAACREVIEQLKRRVPIWKKEIGDDGAEWVGLGP